MLTQEEGKRVQRRARLALSVAQLAAIAFTQPKTTEEVQVFVLHTTVRLLPALLLQSVVVDKSVPTTLDVLVCIVKTTALLAEPVDAASVADFSLVFR